MSQKIDRQFIVIIQSQFHLPICLIECRRKNLSKILISTIWQPPKLQNGKTKCLSKQHSSHLMEKRLSQYQLPRTSLTTIRATTTTKKNMDNTKRLSQMFQPITKSINLTIETAEPTVTTLMNLITSHPTITINFNLIKTMDRSIWISMRLLQATLLKQETHK